MKVRYESWARVRDASSAPGAAALRAAGTLVALILAAGAVGAQTEDSCKAGCASLYAEPVHAWSYSRTACLIGCELDFRKGTRLIHGRLWSATTIGSCRQLPALFNYTRPNGDYLVPRCVAAPRHAACVERCDGTHSQGSHAWSYSRTSCKIGCDLGVIGQSIRTHGSLWQPALTTSCEQLPRRFGYGPGQGAYTVAACNGGLENMRSEMIERRTPVRTEATTVDGAVRLFPETYAVPVAQETTGSLARTLRIDRRESDLQSRRRSAAGQAGTAPGCGDASQRPCRLWESFPSCRRGLVEDFSANRCVLPRDTQLVQRGEEFFARNHLLAEWIAQLARNLIDGEAGRFLQSAEFVTLHAQNRVQDIAARIERQRINGKTLRQLGQEASRGQPFKTMTIGIAQGAGVLVGGSWEFGIALPLTGTGDPVLYDSYALDAGLVQEASAGLSVALWTSEPALICGEGKGFAFSVAPPTIPVSVGLNASFGSLAGMETLPDFNNFSGLGATIAVGVELADLVSFGQLPAVGIQTSSTLTTLQGATSPACSCGGSGQRPCHLVERFPSCNAGLREDFLRHRCV